MFRAATGAIAAIASPWAQQKVILSIAAAVATSFPVAYAGPIHKCPFQCTPDCHCCATDPEVGYCLANKKTTSCTWVGRDFEVDCGSCLGDKACRNAYGAKIKEDSCVGLEACRGAQNSTIGPSSCRGNGGGENNGNPHENYCYLTKNSFVGESSCSGDIGDFSSCQEASYCTINGPSSCFGRWTCNMCNNTIIGTNSCRGEHTCNEMKDLSIGSDSCHHQNACWNWDTSKAIEEERPSFTYAKEQFEKNNGGKCKDGTIPAYDINDQTCVGANACIACNYYLGCLKEPRCNEILTPEDITAPDECGNRNGCPVCRLCQPAGQVEVNVGLGGQEDANFPSLCDGVTAIIEGKIMADYVKHLKHLWDEDLGALGFEGADEGAGGKCGLRMEIPPHPDRSDTKEVVCEFKNKLSALINETDMLSVLKEKHPVAFERVESVSLGGVDGCKGDHKNNKSSSTKSEKKNKDSRSGTKSEKKKTNSSSSFKGNLPYNLYSNAPMNGNGCIESNFVGTGNILSLVPMDEPNTFCEGDVMDPPPPGWPANKTIYTKIELSCSPDDSDNVSVKFFDYEGNSDCSCCTPVHIAAGTTTIGNFTAARDNIEECFYGWPALPLGGGVLPVIGYQSFDEGKGATQAEDEVFFNVLIENSCMASSDKKKNSRSRTKSEKTNKKTNGSKSSKAKEGKEDHFFE